MIAHRLLFVMFLCLSVSLFAVTAHTSSVDITANVSIEKFNQTPMAFTENHGQWDEQVKFRASAGGATLWFTKEGVVYQFTRRVQRDNPGIDDLMRARQDELDLESDSVEQLVIKALFAGSNPNVEIVGEGLMEYKCNYFIGNDPAKWHTDIRNYSSVLYRDVYPGIDIHFYGAGSGEVGYKIISAPKADISQVRFEYDGIEVLAADTEGRLVAHTSLGDMIVASDSRDGDASFAESGILLSSGNKASRARDKNKPRHSTSLVLTLDYSTYLGGSDTDVGTSIAVDGSGAAYVSGYTGSSNFPTLNPYQTDQVFDDVFVTKLSSEGNELVYSTYIGGNGTDRGHDIAVDSKGAAYITGMTYSTNFPTLNSYQTDQGFLDGFVTKLSPTGNSLEYSTYLGGGAAEHCSALAIDSTGAAYVTGNTLSSDFPTLNPYQTKQDSNDVFVTKMSVSGSSLEYSTYLGGSGPEGGSCIAVDSAGSAYVAGGTSSGDFPTLNHYQIGQGNGDAFITKLSQSGDDLVYSTYLGGITGFDRVEDIAIDQKGLAFVAGYTNSTDFPTQNAFQTGYQGGTEDGFVTKLSYSGNELIYSTYLGGSRSDRCNGVAVDSAGFTSATGVTNSEDFPTASPYQTDSDWPNTDGFITRLTATGNALVYSTYLGGSVGEITSGDGCWAIALDITGAAYVTGLTISFDFPTVNPFQPYLSGYLTSDAFVSKLIYVAFECGDADGSGAVDIDDVVYMIAYIFAGGPAPSPLAAGDADCSGAVDIDDVVYLIAYIFSGGPALCDPDGDGIPDC